jgi:septal ring factor EnvC (AmiA/AmiB activator)
MKEKRNSGMLYALADYKQLVLGYKTKHEELVKTVTFWKTSVIWLTILTVAACASVVFLLVEARKSLADKSKDIDMLNSKLEAISNNLDSVQLKLEAAEKELEKKEMLIKELEKNTSTASKKLLERLLKE